MTDVIETSRPLDLATFDERPGDLAIHPRAPTKVVALARLFAVRPHVLALLFITLFGGILRFTYLDRPPLWGDEALTYSRVAGTYRELLAVLETDGFGPLHYSAYWALARVFHLDPFMMRLLPALAGSLMVPAVYFLARQIVSIRTALLACAFTACSAFLLVYARDAKMYAHFWLFCTLCMGCFLWWLREGTRLSFLCWIAAGCAMIGTHAPGGVILAIQPIILLTHARLRWWKTVCYVLGVAVIASGPVGYYEYFNRFQQRTEENWGNSGITWVALYNQGRSGPQVVLYTASAFLFSWEWPKDQNLRTLRPWVLQLGMAATCLSFTLFTIGAMPWPRRLRGARAGVVEPIRGLLPAASELGGGAANAPVKSPPTALEHPRADLYIPDRPRAQTEPSHDENAKILRKGTAPHALFVDPLEMAPEHWWRRLLWLALWIVVPTYAYYCASVDHPTSPLEWLDMGRAFVGPGWWILLIETLVVAGLCSAVRPARGVLLTALVGGAVVMLNVAVAKFGTDAPLDTLVTWSGWVTGTDVLLGALPVVAALAWVWSGEHTLARAGRLLQFLCVTAFIGLLCYAVFVACLAHTAKDIRMPRYLGVIWPALAIAGACLLRRLPTVALRWPAITFLLAANLFNAAMRVWAGCEPPLDQMAADIRTSESVGTTTRTYTSYRGEGGGPPGTGDMNTTAGRYYLCIDFLRDLSPPDFRGRSTDTFFTLRRLGGDALAQDLAGSPHLTRAIVWDRLDVNHPDFRDRLAPRLRPGGWTTADEQLMTVRDHWDWREKSIARRRVYERKIDTPVGEK